METNRVCPSTFGIRNIIHFKSGAALLTVDKDKIDSFKNHLPALGLSLKEATRPREHSFRIHQIPKFNSEADVAEDIAALSDIPTFKIKVSLVQYREALRPNTQMAVIKGDSSLLQFARPTMLIGATRCPVDITLRIMRCSTCSLFGHTRNHCLGIPETVATDMNDGKGCGVCLLHNHETAKAGLPKSRFRPTNHLAGSQQCRTKAALIKKYLAARRTQEPPPQ